jgi:hypothetical protein
MDPQPELPPRDRPALPDLVNGRFEATQGLVAEQRMD